jgi:CRP-like cAMP-binding protein
MSLQIQSYKNELLNALSPNDLALLTPHLEEVRLDVPYMIEKANAAIEHVYFLESGLASIVAKLSGGRDIEVGIAGREGVTGVSVILGGTQSPNTTFMQVSGSGHRLPADAFRTALGSSASLRATLFSYTQSLLIQTGSTVLANGHSKLEERLARWLLMVHDRLDGTIVPLTHEFLSVMLGVRRPGVTVALHILEGKGFIRAMRGQITIVNRKGLIDEANGSYGVAEQEYQRLLGIKLAR